MGSGERVKIPAVPESDLFERLRLRVLDLPGLELAVVFGSTSRGEARSRSDVDLGLLLAVDTPEARRRVEVELGRAAGREVDLVYLNEAPPQLRFEIARDGILLVESRPYLWADVKARAMIDWWDWAPIARRLHQAAIERIRREAAHGPS